MGRTYLQVGSARLIDIQVILDDNQVIYEGRAEDAPGEIKRLKYSNMELKCPAICYVYSEDNDL